MSYGKATTFLPVLDLLFGTAYLPDRWPSTYGLANGHRAPRGYLAQLRWPFRRSRGRR